MLDNTEINKNTESMNPESINQEAVNQELDLQSFPQLLDTTLPADTKLKNKIVQGTVVAVDKEYVTISIGLKNEGRISVSEFEDQIPVPGDIIPVYIFHLENRQSECVLSYSKVKKNMIWNELNDLFEKKQPVEGKVINSVKGGYTVDVKGLNAFLPGSQLDYNLMNNGNIIGKSFSLHILKIDTSRINIVVSQKRINQAEQMDKRNQILNTIQEGDIVEGRIKNLTNYGAFIDLNGIDGLLHITDISWYRISHPQDVLELDSKIKIKVIKLNREKGRINLGLKQLTKDPWQDIDQKYKKGDVVDSSILSVTDYGAFVKLEENIEGLIHVSEVDWYSNNIVAKDVFQIGENIRAVILEVNKEKKRIALGIKQLTSNPWVTFSQKYKRLSILSGKIIKIIDQGLVVRLNDEKITGFIDIHNIDSLNKEATEEDLKAELRKNYQLNQTIQVTLINVILEKEKIILSIRGFNKLDSKITDVSIGQTLTCAITHITKQGLYVKTHNDKYSGFISIGNISTNRLERNANKFSIGEKVDANVIGFGFAANKNLLLSIKDLESKQKKEIIAEFGSATSGARLGDILGVALQEKEKAILQVQQKKIEASNKNNDKLEQDTKSDQ